MKQIIEDCKRVEIEDDGDRASKTISIIRNDGTFVKIDISYARLKGEWVNEWREIKGGRAYGACCSLCHINGHSGYNFCPKCGADMRGKEE